MPRSPRSSRLLASFALAAAAGTALPGALACNRCDLYYLPIEWQAEEVPVDADLFAVAVAKGVVVAVGDGGAIARQAGEGAWTAPASATDAALRGVEFATAEVVIAVGEGGVVVRSVDAGETWAVVDAGVTDDLAAVGCHEAGTCVAAGDGVLLVSTDAGASWAPPASAPAELGALRAVGVNNGYDEFVAVGLAGAIVISPDAQTWTAVPGASADFHAVALTASDWALGGADGALIILANGVLIDLSQFDRATITGLTREGEWMARADGVVVHGYPAWAEDGGGVRTEEELPPLHAVVAIGDEAVVVGDDGTVGRVRLAEERECDRRYH
ncbi:hypothetical protein OV203_19675 [Nannocystis sp. ILAH1]|uniref:WD40/YVTN/BNR-like repeat-containing protein n=1 Tax=Nannocystis sp. ILAH1 TaxID=2996789 RepID=UPI00226EC574|nr:hypothetical protein [Nannocystis sp. ILAH1]MCY0989369.1 hypothetical protein [Nannocystis sp. ILAH1]